MKREPEPDKLVEAICREIPRRRKELGMTVYALSQESGVSQQAIANYEKLARQPTIECLIKVAKGLGLTPSQLLSRAEARIHYPSPPAF